MSSSMIPIYLIVLVFCVDFSVSADAINETVSKHGQLSVNGTNILNQYGEIVQLKGNSLAWSVWWPQYWNKPTVDGVHEYCHANILRASMGVNTSDGGYLTDPEKHLKLLTTVVDAAIENDMYVIIDWHIESSDQYQEEAVEFFDMISKKYGKYPNIIYETFNEPMEQSWSEDLKPYHEAVINAIRANDPNNIIICGTPQWSQRVDEAAADPITNQTNIMYTLHFYAGTHKQWLRDLAQGALDKGLPIFITEYGTVSLDEDNIIDLEESQLWWEWCDENNLSYVNWYIGDSSDSAAVLIANTPIRKVCQERYLTESGKLVIEQNMK